MRFLLRAAFWFGLVLLLLPAGRSSDSDARQNAAVAALDAASAATATFSDMRLFCTRQPDACAVGAQVATAAGQRAQVGAKMLYEFFSDKLAAESDGAATGAGGARRESVSPGKGVRDTLTHGDLTPDWRGPGTSKEPSQKRARNES
jgi:cytosine/adenosine deaminase-related metal-dependent hydrolase